MKQHAPYFDQGLSALIEDLHQRGMDKDVSVVAWGEFGRTPKINKDGGRDHYPKGWITCRVGDFTLETDFEVDPGQVLVLFGPSGAGKTTTLRSIAGLLRPQQGQIQLSGQLVYDSAADVWVPPHLRRVPSRVEDPVLAGRCPGLSSAARAR